MSPPRKRCLIEYKTRVIGYSQVGYSQAGNHSVGVLCEHNRRQDEPVEAEAENEGVGTGIMNT